MKKILFLLSFVAIAFASCDPLSQAYKDVDNAALNANGKVGGAPVLALTLKTSYTTLALATTGITSTLNSSYSQYNDGSKATVSYVVPSNAVFAPDVTLSHVAYTVTTADYAFAGSTFTDFTTANAQAFLAYKYPSPVPFQLVALTYNYFESGYTASTGTLTTDVYMYLNGTWIKTYGVTSTQYASVNRSLANTFGTADLANIPTYLANFLKADASVTLTAKAGDIKWVSYRYNTTTVGCVPMLFDGTNWSSRYVINFIKTNGTWVVNNALFYTFVSADYTAAGAASAPGTAAAKTSVAQFGDYDHNLWPDADLNASIAAILLTKVATIAPKVNQEVDVTYKAFNPSGTEVRGFVYDGTKFTAQ
ncbi:hypothetical protein ACFGVR_11950 [Mucilaginibacter sp. AW1-3]